MKIIVLRQLLILCGICAASLHLALYTSYDFDLLLRSVALSRLPRAGKDGKRSKKQYRRDQTERRQKRIERSKAKGASKDVWGLRREGTACVYIVHSVALHLQRQLHRLQHYYIPITS